MSQPSSLGTPAAELELNVTLARALVAAQHPDLGDLPVTLAAAGWDNAMFRLGSEFSLCLPAARLRHAPHGGDCLGNFARLLQDT